MFRRKQAKENKEEDVKNINKSTYKVFIYEKVGGAPRLIKELIATRWVDQDDLIPYLKYEDKKKGERFLEIFPQQGKDLIDETEKELKTKLDKFRKKLKDERAKDEPSVNFKDLEFEIMKLEAKERIFKYDPNASYISLGENNLPEFYFLREGSNFHPFKWDCETKTIYTPSDNKKKSATIALRNKEAKYPNLDNRVKITSMILLAVGLLFAVGFGYLTYKAYDSYSESELNQIKTTCLQDLTQTTGAVKASANSIAKITADLDKQLNKPTTIVQGSQTKTFE